MAIAPVLPEYFSQLLDAHYWANHIFLEAAAALSPEQLTRHHAHSWGSVFALLVHMYGAEWIWRRRFLGESPTTLPKPEDFAGLSELSQRWTELEADLRAFAAAQMAESLSRPVSYRNTRGVPYTLELWKLMAHVVNHGTHHRGELAAMFALLQVPHREDDWYLYFLEQSGQGG